MQSRHITAVLLVYLVSKASLGHCQVLAPTGAAPLYVALVEVHDLAPLKPGTGAARSAAASLRAAGYPASPSLSKAPLPRASDAAQQPPAPVNNFAVAVPLGPGGPTLDPADLMPSSTSNSTRRRLQQKPSSSSSSSSSNSSSSSQTEGFNGISMPAPAGTSSIAVGPHHVLQAAGAAVSITDISSTTGAWLPGSSRTVALAALMAGAAADCEDVFDPSAVFDQAANRFLVTATCGGQGRVLLAASASSDANGSWFVYGLVADGVGSSLACVSPVEESAVVDYTRVSYNSDGIFITYKSLCPSNASHTGWGLLALPKHNVYQGLINFFYPLYTSSELQQAVAAASASSGSTSSGSAGSSCYQLEPVVPQGPADVPAGTAYFVCEEVPGTPAAPTNERGVTVAALLDTAMLWTWGGPDSKTSTPLLVAQQLTLAGRPVPSGGFAVRQPQGAVALQQGSKPQGFWNGAAVLAGGKLYLASSAMATSNGHPMNSRHPAIAWAELSVSTTTSGTDNCPQSKAGTAVRQAWDWATDHSINWGSQFDVNYTLHANASFMPRLTGAASTGTTSHSVIKAQGLLGGALWALYGGDPCTCYRCYWGGGYYRYGGYNGGNLAGTGFGYSSQGYYFAQGQMTRCQTTCTRCWYYGYPGYGFGNVGDDISNIRVRSVQGELTPITSSTASGPHIATLAGVDFATLFTECSRSGSLSANVLRQGVITQGGERPVGLLFPAVALGPAGQLLVVFSYAGPGNITRDTPAYLGVGAVTIPAGSTSSSSLQLVKPGRGTIRPAAAAGASSLGNSAATTALGWAELSAAAVHAASGRVYTAVHYAVEGTALSNNVGTWISSFLL